MSPHLPNLIASAPSRSGAPARTPLRISPSTFLDGESPFSPASQVRGNRRWCSTRSPRNPSVCSMRRSRRSCRMFCRATVSLTSAFSQISRRQSSSISNASAGIRARHWERRPTIYRLRGVLFSLLGSPRFRTLWRFHSTIPPACVSLRKGGGLVDAPGRWLVGTNTENPP
jgi:hypothetical protein